MQKLGIVGPSKRINVVSYNGATSNVCTSVVHFSISSLDETSKFEVKHAYAVDHRTPGNSSAPLTYHMTFHVFGLISSPTTCIYAPNRTVEDHRDQFPEAADSVRRTFNVDNYLDAFDSEDEIVKRARQIKNLLQLSGFHLTKWTFSSRNLIAALREFGLATPTLNLDLDKLPIE